MRLALSLFGCEVLSIETGVDEQPPSGDCIASPMSVGFTNMHGGFSEEDR